MRTKSYLLTAAVITLIACGGGGGGSSSKFAGVWSGTVSLVEDTCGLVAPDSQFVFFTHLVNQDDEDIILDNGLVTFSGNTEGESSFRVTATRPHAPLSEGSTCTEAITWRYENVKRDNAPFVVRSSTVTCQSGQTASECTFAFSGSAFRTDGNGGGGFPIPVDDGVGGSTGGTTASDAAGAPETTL